MQVKIHLKNGEEPIHGSSWYIEEPSNMIVLTGIVTGTVPPHEKVHEYHVPIDNILYVEELKSE